MAPTMTMMMESTVEKTGYHKLTHGMKVEPVAPREEEANPEEE